MGGGGGGTQPKFSVYAVSSAVDIVVGASISFSAVGQNGTYSSVLWQISTNNSSFTDTAYTASTSNIKFTSAGVYYIRCRAVYSGTYYYSSSVKITVHSGKISYGTVTITHSLKATASNYTGLQWQHSNDNKTWTVLSETGNTLVIGKWTGAEGEIGTDIPLQNAQDAITAYSGYYRCIAINGNVISVSNTLYVKHDGGAGNPLVTSVD